MNVCISRTIRFIFILFMPLISASASAQDSDTKRCADLQTYHLLDFWVGTWNVYVGAERVGFNRIEKTLDGCAVLEHWTDASGNEGKSLFFVSDSATWKQVWVTEWASRPGGVKEKTHVDISPEKGVRFKGRLQHPDVGEWLDRTTLKPLDNGEVRQIIETSTDGGKTWEVGFDAIYRRSATE